MEAFSILFLSVRLLHTPTVDGIGYMLYFGDLSVFLESELNGSNIPGQPPSPHGVEVTGWSIPREDAGIMVLPSTAGLTWGMESQWLPRGRRVQ